MLNRAGGFMINDAYAVQAADALGLVGARRVRAGSADAYAEACLDILRARCVDAEPAPIHRSAVAGPQALARAAAALAARRRDGWGDVWGAALRAAGDGRAFHGWNTPPDHLRAEDILSAFPEARFVFLMRDPFAVLRSYRALPEYWGRARARYHPTLQARAWAASVRSLDRLNRALPGRAHALRYEDLLDDPRGAMAALSEFIGAPLAAPDPAELPANGSRADAGLSRAEIWAARRALGDLPERMGYAPPRPEGRGLARLARCTAAAAGYYALEAARSRDMRGRILRLARA